MSDSPRRPRPTTPLWALTPPHWLAWDPLAKEVATTADDPRGLPTVRTLDRFRDALRRRHYSRRTEKAYTAWVRRFLAFHGYPDPAGLGAAEVRAYLTHLAGPLQLAASSQNQAFSALLFLFREVLVRSLDGLEDVLTARGCPCGSV